MELALTADLGNTRLKLCAWNLADGTVVARQALDAHEGLGRSAGAFARQHAPFRAAALSSVALREREDEVSAALERACGGLFLLAPDCGLAIETREPARVGRDRLYAARGALESGLSRGGGWIVLDAGTALTVDAVDARDGGRFLGGAIAPGPALLARALAEHTARLPLVEPAARAPALGRDTESAVRAGIVVGFRGAARELALRVAEEAGWPAPRIAITGGARGLLLDPALFTPPDFAAVHEDEDLVHRGLLASLRAALAT
ncbi:MAG: type III pantothenate kinase [Planctomycetota bacterium]|nr:type III pantothenate kinase [Planctomycetota bacterium]